MPHVSVIIPVYKNVDAFARLLSHNIPYLEDCDICVVNDDPEASFPEGIPIELRPQRNILWINHQRNVGFGPSVNDGANHAQGEYMMLLNSDVKLLDDSWHQALRAFDDEKVFAVGFAQRERDGSLVGRNTLTFTGGLFEHHTAPWDSQSSDTFLTTAWAEGGAMMVLTSLWRELHGFDDRYSPFYWEDIDLSYRAMRHGWSVLFAPGIVVDHHHESTIGTQFDHAHVRRIAFRNQLRFTQEHAQGLQKIQYLLARYITLPLRGFSTDTP